MFYLLENNRIIDSQIPYAHAKSLPFWEDKVGHLRVKDRIGKSYQVFKYDKIIKRSENVLDLIEEGDLVRVLNTIVKVEEIMKNTVMATALNVPFDVTMIDAIYKPDDKGNYIKVWERKENETCNGTN